MVTGVVLHEESRPWASLSGRKRYAPLRSRPFRAPYVTKSTFTLTSSFPLTTDWRRPVEPENVACSCAVASTKSLLGYRFTSNTALRAEERRGKRGGEGGEGGEGGGEEERT